MEGPAEVFELLLPKTVAVAGRITGVVRGSIALDGQDELARLGWVTGREVNPELRAADLRDDFYPLGAEGSYTFASKSFMGSLVRSPWERSAPPELAYWR